MTIRDEQLRVVERGTLMLDAWIGQCLQERDQLVLFLVAETEWRDVDVELSTLCAAKSPPRL